MNSRKVKRTTKNVRHSTSGSTRDHRRVLNSPIRSDIGGRVMEVEIVSIGRK